MRVGMCKAILGQSTGEIIHAFLLAHHARPTRAEPLYHIARTYREILEMPAVGYIFAKRAAELPYPKDDILFIAQDTYTWQALDELATCAHSVGDIHIGLAASQKLLSEGHLPQEQVERVTGNYKIYHQLVSQYQAHIAQEQQAKDLQQKMEKKHQKEERKNRVKKPTKQKSRKQKIK